MRFGLSTHLFHGARLTQAHLAAIRERDFALVEIFATRTHVDYRDPAEIATVARWMRELALEPWSLHAPITTGFTGGAWGRAFSTASPDAATRDEAVAETVAAADAARDLGCRIVVQHIGIPTGQPIPPGDNDAGAARDSLERIADACQARGLQLALEVIPNALSTADAIAGWLESDLGHRAIGACLDLGHAHLSGDAAEAAERLGGHLLTTHVHDNRGRDDDHLVPFDGTIDWAGALLALCKVGYQGPLIFELPDHGDAARVLTRAVAARTRIQGILEDLAAPFPFDDDA